MIDEAFRTRIIGRLERWFPEHLRTVDRSEKRLPPIQSGDLARLFPPPPSPRNTGKRFSRYDRARRIAPCPTCGVMVEVGKPSRDHKVAELLKGEIFEIVCLVDSNRARLPKAADAYENEQRQP